MQNNWRKRNVCMSSCMSQSMLMNRDSTGSSSSLLQMVKCYFLTWVGTRILEILVMSKMKVITQLWSSPQFFSIFQVIILVFWPSVFTVLVHCHSSHQCCFWTQQTAVMLKTHCTWSAQIQTADRQSCYFHQEPIKELIKQSLKQSYKEWLKFIRWPETLIWSVLAWCVNTLLFGKKVTISI